MTVYEALQALNILDESGNSKSNIKSNLRILLLHMLKAKYQPEYENKSSWRGSIINAFENITDEFPEIGKGNLYKNFYIKELSLPQVYRSAVLKASEETGKPINVFPQTCEWTKEQLVDIEFIYEFINKYCPRYSK